MPDTQVILVDAARLQDIERKLDAMVSLLAKATIAPRPNWLTVAQYAEAVAKTTRTVNRWVEAGKVETRRAGEELLIKAPWAD